MPGPRDFLCFGMFLAEMAGQRDAALQQPRSKMRSA
jgi:hypothetical protein